MGVWIEHPAGSYRLASVAPQLRICKSGINLNRLATTKLKIGEKFKFCKLFFDAEDKRIGVWLFKQKQKGCYSFRISEGRTFIAGKGFCERFDLIEKCRALGINAFTIQQDNEEADLYIASLKKE